MKFCPIKALEATISLDRGEGSIEVKDYADAAMCVPDCGWYDDTVGACAFRSIAKGLQSLVLMPNGA